VTRLVQGLLLAGALVIITLWLHDGGISGVNSAATGLSSAGRLTGLLAAYLLPVQVLMLARLPLLEWIAGFDRLTHWHKLNGKIVLYLILVHVVLITVGYAMTRKVSVLAESSILLSQYYGIVAALVGTLLIILVVVSSLFIVRRRLRFETWYAVHLVAYAGVTLTYFHETRTGLDFIANPLAAAYWLGFYLVTLQLVIIFRILQPVFRNGFHKLRVGRVVKEPGQATSVYVTGRHLDWLNAKAGQFFIWRFATPGRVWEAHPFSLSAAPNGRWLRLTAKAVGDFTTGLNRLKPGTRVIVEGPFGSMTDDIRSRDKVALIAGGIGITPLRALAETMTGDVVLIYRAMTDADIVFREELDALAEKRHFRVHYIVGDHRLPENRDLMSPAHLRRIVPDISAREIYLCGPPAMVDAIEDGVRHLGVPDKCIHVERFAFAT